MRRGCPNGLSTEAGLSYAPLEAASADGYSGPSNRGTKPLAHLRKNATDGRSGLSFAVADCPGKRRPCRAGTTHAARIYRELHKLARAYLLMFTHGHSRMIMAVAAL
jgi:hypothetical protein